MHYRCQVLLERGRYRAVVGRAYYAVFHAATAALLAKGIERRSHHAIISAFGEFLVKTGTVDPKFHRFIREMFDLRLESDYQPVVSIKPEQAELLLQRAREFLEICRQLCLDQ